MILGPWNQQVVVTRAVVKQFTGQYIFNVKAMDGSLVANMFTIRSISCKKPFGWSRNITQNINDCARHGRKKIFATYKAIFFIPSWTLLGLVRNDSDEKMNGPPCSCLFDCRMGWRWWASFLGLKSLQNWKQDTAIIKVYHKKRYCHMVKKSYPVCIVQKISAVF